MISKKFIKKTKKKGTLFWIEGFSGAGKTSISRVTAKILRKKISNLVLIQGNEMRSLLQLKGFSKKERISASNYSSELIKFLTNNGINVMYTVLCLNNRTRKIYKNKIDNFLQIYVDSSVNQIIKKNLKPQIYKLKKNIVGVDIKPDYPKKNNIVIKNNFSKKIKELGTNLAEEIIICCNNKL
tara:strand:- start:89 stop:637 length:549 start_codon:yes stop_codon:yes gene_type:complete